jgi:type I restriction enzyme, S subunit
MKGRWEVKELSTVSAINYGYTESASSEPVGPRFLRITDIQNDQVNWDNVPYCKIEPTDAAKYRLQSGDIVFARTGATTGKSFLVNDPPDAVFASYLIRLRLLDGRLLPEFVSLFFQTAGYWKSIKEGSAGSAQGGFNATKLGALSIPIPPLTEQRRIVGILDEAFDSIATAKAKAEKNLQNASALFGSHLQAVFTQNSDKPLMQIGNVAKVYDGPHATPKTVDAGPIFLGISALQDGRVNLGETRHVTPEDFRQWTRRVKPQPGDVVFSYETRLGQAAIIPEGLECCLGRRMALVRVDKKLVDPRFFVYQYISPPFREFLASKTVRGATVDRIPLKEFPSFPITLPHLAVQKRIADRLDSLQEETRRLESVYRRKLSALDELKKSLLHKAFTGEL